METQPICCRSLMCKLISFLNTSPRVPCKSLLATASLTALGLHRCSSRQWSIIFRICLQHLHLLFWGTLYFHTLLAYQILGSEQFTEKENSNIIGLLTCLHRYCLVYIWINTYSYYVHYKMFIYKK